jgi:hypothetical protein
MSAMYCGLRITKDGKRHFVHIRAMTFRFSFIQLFVSETGQTS